VRVFVTGATGVLGTPAVAALLADGHQVTGLARSPQKAAALTGAGAVAATVDLFDVEALTAALAGHDAVCNLATSIPVGMAALRPGAWRANDRLRNEGSKVVATAARAAGVRRLVQESISLQYADAGDAWITESSPVCVTRAVEPAAVAETVAEAFFGRPRESVILRFGNFVGDDPVTRWRIDQALKGRPVGLGDPEGWIHLVHPADAGAAVAAALTAPAGVYNVGAEPVRRRVLNQAFADAAGRPQARLVPQWFVTLAGERLEPLTRSLRVSSARLHEMTGWMPEFDAFAPSWLSPACAT
jgi:nucleoside-diphosphate-sugar epimerase